MKGTGKGGIYGLFLQSVYNFFTFLPNFSIDIMIIFCMEKMRGIKCVSNNFYSKWRKIFIHDKITEREKLIMKFPIVKYDKRKKLEKIILPIIVLLAKKHNISFKDRFSVFVMKAGKLPYRAFLYKFIRIRAKIRILIIANFSGVIRKNKVICKSCCVERVFEI